MTRATNSSSLDEISRAIGALEAGQENNAKQLLAHMETSSAQNKTMLEKIDALSASIDGKIDRKTGQIMAGGVGGGIIFIAEFIAQTLGFKLPGAH